MLRKRRPDARRPEGEANDAAAALTAAVACLSRRDYCSAELAGRLSAQGFVSDAVQGALAELIEQRYVDDERYAQLFVTLHTGRGHGPLRIQRDLIGLGLAPPLAAAALQSYADGQDGWAKLAREVRTRRFGLELPKQWPQIARQARFLQYRGFSNDHIRSALGNDAISDTE